eukprot:EG_transcript_29387
MSVSTLQMCLRSTDQRDPRSVDPTLLMGNLNLSPTLPYVFVGGTPSAPLAVGQPQLSPPADSGDVSPSAAPAAPTPTPSPAPTAAITTSPPLTPSPLLPDRCYRDTRQETRGPRQGKTVPTSPVPRGGPVASMDMSLDFRPRTQVRTGAMGSLQKALELNLDNYSYGTIAEIGAGQEVARTFFKAGGAAGTVAKTLSAFDMAINDAEYGAGGDYVSLQRL